MIAPRFVSLFAFGFAFFVAGVSSAKTPLALPKTKTTRALAGSYDDGLLEVAACEKTPCAGGGEKLEIDVPKLQDRSTVKSEKLTLKDGVSLLHVTFGTSRQFHVLVAPPKLDAPAGARPELLLKGYSGGPKDSVFEVVSGAKGEKSLFVHRVSSGAVCGRDAPVAAERFDTLSRRFVPTRLPPLGASERKGAEDLSVVAPSDALTVGTLAFRLAPAATSEEAALWFDGSVETSEASPWESVSLPLAAEAKALSIRLPEGAPAQDLWFADGKKVYRAALVANVREQVVVLPAREGAGCFSLVSDGKAAGISEVAELVPYPYEKEIPALVRALDTDRRELAGRALRLVAEEAAPLLAREYKSLSSVGRGAALELARSEPTGVFLPTVLRALGAGTPSEQRRAEQILVDRKKVFLPRLLLAFQKATPAEEGFLGGLVLRLEPALLLEHLLPKLDVESPARRSGLRELVVEGLRNEQILAQVRSALGDAKLNERVRIELLRAVGPRVRELRPEATTVLESLLRSGDFRSAYLLAEPTLLLLEDSETLDRQVSALVAANTKWSATQRSAYLAVLFEAALDRELGARTATKLVGVAQKELVTEAVRVRRAAAAYLGKNPSPAAASALGNLAEADPWPLVREEALLSLGAYLGTAESLDVEKIVMDRLEDDEVVRVRKAAARALEKSSSEESLQALRRALGRDDSYSVRGSAASALGARCAVDAVDELTDLSLVLLRKGASEGEVELAWAALGALAEIGPKDYETRVAPLFADGVPGPLKSQIRMIAARPVGRCNAMKPRAGAPVR